MTNFGYKKQNKMDPVNISENQTIFPKIQSWSAASKNKLLHNFSTVSNI